MYAHILIKGAFIWHIIILPTAVAVTITTAKRISTITNMNTAVAVTTATITNMNTAVGAAMIIMSMKTVAAVAGMIITIITTMNTAVGAAMTMDMENAAAGMNISSLTAMKG